MGYVGVKVWGHGRVERATRLHMGWFIMRYNPAKIGELGMLVKREERIEKRE
jgi:hypothetical protein